MSTGEIPNSTTNNSNNGSTRQSSKFGFSGGRQSLNASEHRIKNLADDDTNYEVVKGGKVPPVVGLLPASPETLLGGLNVMRDAGSQTLTTTTAEIAAATVTTVTTPPDINVSRPTQFGTQFGELHTPRSGGLSSRSIAPLATIETTSELGTPTPMEENKAFVRATAPHHGLPSHLPQPCGRPRFPLPSHIATPNRYAFSPSSSFSQSPSSHNTEPPSAPPPLAVTHKASKVAAIRPTGLVSPRQAPPTTLNALSGRLVGATDNVMITTTNSTGLGAFVLKPSALSMPNGVGGGGLAKPGSVASVRSRAAKGTGSSESVRASSSASSTPKPQSSTTTTRLPNGLGKHTAAEETATESILRDLIELGTPLKKPAIPKQGSSVRTPHSTGGGGGGGGAQARGPLASQSQSHHTAVKNVPTLPTYQPAKPLRKSPQSQSGGVSISSSTLLEGHESVRADGKTSTNRNETRATLSPSTFTSGLPALPSIPIFNSLAAEETRNISDSRDRSDEDGGSIFSEREGLAEMPKSYRVPETVLDDIEESIHNVKKLAQELLQLHDSNAKALSNGYGDMQFVDSRVEDYSTADKYRSEKGDLLSLLQPPSDKTLKDPVAAGQLIKDLQSAVRFLLALPNGQ
ncbi:hypothetical protein BV898_05304 [Hypsibius exemplaris]|uniref:Uncharacterized protein n=1 Tax=Hypsibius exemplaris TaxID=2072580 RepID=A0A1W0X057_HYPEX|nr:hypothetical protein BV898_05304 [Hypsibius exemplaris]